MSVRGGDQRSSLPEAVHAAVARWEALESDSEQRKEDVAAEVEQAHEDRIRAVERRRKAQTSQYEELSKRIRGAFESYGEPMPSSSDATSSLIADDRDLADQLDGIYQRVLTLTDVESPQREIVSAPEVEGYEPNEDDDWAGEFGDVDPRVPRSPPAERPGRHRGWSWRFLPRFRSRTVLVLAAISMALWVALWSPWTDDALTLLCRVPGAPSVLPCAADGQVSPLPLIDTILPTEGSSDLAQRLVSAVREGSGRVELGRGRFGIDRPFVVSGDLRVSGRGSEVSIIELSGGAAGLSFQGGGRLELADVALLLTPAATGDVVVVEGGQFLIERVTITGGTASDGVAGAGLVIRGDARGLVRDCVVTGNTIGIVVTDQAAPTIEACRVERNLARGVSFHGRSGGQVRESTVAGNGFMKDRDDYWQGIAVEDQAQPRIVDSTVRANAGVGIQYLDEAGGVSRGNLIAENGANHQVFLRASGRDTVSVGGIALGIVGRFDQPTPTLTDNRFVGNTGGTIVDYRTEPSEVEPSFDCREATAWSEQAICDAPSLARLDRAIASTYERLRRHLDSSSFAMLRLEQRRWLVQRDACRDRIDGVGCLEDMLAERLGDLERRMDSAP